MIKWTPEELDAIAAADRELNAEEAKARRNAAKKAKSRDGSKCPEIGERAAEEVDRLAWAAEMTPSGWLLKNGFAKCSRAQWRRGAVPSTQILQRLAKAGVDIYYILLGERWSDP